MSHQRSRLPGRLRATAVKLSLPAVERSCSAYGMEPRSADFMAPLHPDDGHTFCPSCLCVDHPTEALTDAACMNFSTMSREVRLTRLNRLVQPPTVEDAAGLEPAVRKRPDRGAGSGPQPVKRRRVTPEGGFYDHSSRRIVEDVERREQASRMDRPESDMQGIPTREGVSRFNPDPSSLFRNLLFDARPERKTRKRPSHFRLEPVIKATLGRLQIDTPPATQPQPCYYYKRSTPPTTKTAIPHSKDFLSVLHSSWRETPAPVRQTSNERTLADMLDPETVGLLHMPVVDTQIAALVLPPDEAVKPDPKCPSAQCKITDDYICRAYASAARAARFGNTLSHFLTLITTSVQETGSDDLASDACDAALHTFAYLTKALGDVLATLVHTRRHVWLAQSALPESTRRALRNLPTEPGVLFGPGSREILDRAAEVDHARQRFSRIRRSMALQRAQFR